MSDRRWTLWVRDDRGKRHRGVVTYTDDAPTEPPPPPSEFHISLLTKPAPIRTAPDATAVCVPQLAREPAAKRAPPPLTHRDIVAGLKRGELPATLHARYAGGRIVLPAGHADPASVFRAKCTVDLGQLALLLIAQAHAEALAPYKAIIRRELHVTRGEDPLDVLAARLSPDDSDERPPARAPGILRLAAALRRLRAGAVPQIDVETLIEDLRFLRLFERDEATLGGPALSRLLADVIGAAPTTRKRTRRLPASIVPLRRRQNT